MATASSTAATSSVYIQVIEDVVNKVRDEFINNNGPGEAVLGELQALWELKMMQAGVVCGPIERSAGNNKPVHDLNVPYEGTEEYETPTADMLFPPTPLQTPLPTPLPGSAQTPLPGTAPTPLPGSVDNSSMYNIPTGSSSEYATPVSDTGGSAEPKTGRPSPYMQPPSPWMGQRPPLDVNVAYEEGREEADRGTSNQPLTQDFFMGPGKRKREDFPAQYSNGGFIPQQDGSGDTPFEVLQASKGKTNAHGRCNTTADIEILSNTDRQGSKIPQSDGPIPDPYDELSTPNVFNYQTTNEDYNIANTPAPNDMQAGTPAIIPPNEIVEEDEEDEPLNEDDDDEDDLDDVEHEDMNTQHLVLAQFDKVTRTKSRWKCTLKDGIMHINNKDILFNKANGEFDF